MPSLTKYRFAIPLIVVALALAVVGINQSATAQAKEEPKPGSKLTLTVEGVEYTFCYIPAGTFMMGSPESEKGRGAAEKLHKVIISKGFYMLENEVTQEQFGKEPDFKDSVRTGSHFRGAKLPVEDRGFHEANYSKFAKALMKATGRKIRLPTEAEWEYACRAGTTTPFHNGQTLSSRQANCYPGDGNVPYREQTSRVGAYPPNPWGLFDMHGNVAEWCADFHGNYPPGTALDPKGPATGKSRVCRGGSWMSEARHCRAARRDHSAPGISSADQGFRVVLCLGSA